MKHAYEITRRKSHQRGQEAYCLNACGIATHRINQMARGAEPRNGKKYHPLNEKGL